MNGRSVTKQVYEYVEGSEFHMNAIKKSRYLRRVSILDWFRRMGWITAEQRLFMGIQETFRQYYIEERKAHSSDEVPA